MSEHTPMPDLPPPKKYPYKAFISYHHATDQALAPKLRSALQRFAKPFYRMRACKVFLDESSLGVSAEGFLTLQAALDQSEFLILLASRGAARSEWVGKELDYFLTSRGDGAKKLLIILTDGKIDRRAGAQDFDWERTDALPKILTGKVGGTPIWLDMSWTRTSEALAKNKERFLDDIAGLASTLHGREKDELVGEDIRQQARLKTVAGSAMTAIVALIAFLGFLAWQNMKQKALAGANRLAFQSESLRSSDIVSSAGAALKAIEKAPNDTTWSALLNAYYHMGNGWLLSRYPLGKDGIQTLSFSDSGQEILFATRNAVQILSLDGSKKPVALPAVTGIASAFYRPGNSDQILVAHDQTASIWSLHDAKRLWKLDEQKEAMESATWSGNGERVLLASRDGKVSVYSATTGQLIRSWQAGPAAALSFDGQWVALSSKENQVFIVSVDQKEGTPTGEPVAQPGEIRRLAFSPDGKFLAVAFEQLGLELFRVDQQKLDRSQSMEGHKDRIYSLQFSPDSSLLVSASDDGAALVWSARVGTPDGEPTSWALAQGRLPRSPLLKTLRHVSDPKTEEPLEHGNAGGNRTNEVNFAAFSPRGNAVATGLLDGSVALWFLGGDIAASQRFPGAIQQSVYIPHSSRVASASGDGQVYIWDLGGPGRVALQTDAWAECVALSPDGERLAIGDQKGNLSYWAANGKGGWEARWKKSSHKDKITSCSFSPSGKTLLSTGLDGNIFLWESSDTPGSPRPIVYAGAPSRVWSGTFSHDGRFILAAGEMDSIYIFSILGRTELAMPAKGQILAAAFDPSDRRILSVHSSNSHEVRLWSRSGQPLAQLAHPTDDSLEKAVFSADGDWIISATMSGVVRVWDVSAPNFTYRELLKWQAHDDWVENVALSPTGDYLLSSGYDGRVRQWPISAQVIRERLTHLTRKEDLSQIIK